MEPDRRTSRETGRRQRRHTGISVLAPTAVHYEKSAAHGEVMVQFSRLTKVFSSLPAQPCPARTHKRVRRAGNLRLCCTKFRCGRSTRPRGLALPPKVANAVLHSGPSACRCGTGDGLRNGPCVGAACLETDRYSNNMAIRSSAREHASDDKHGRTNQSLPRDVLRTQLR